MLLTLHSSGTHRGSRVQNSDASTLALYARRGDSVDIARISSCGLTSRMIRKCGVVDVRQGPRYQEMARLFLNLFNSKVMTLKHDVTVHFLGRLFEIVLTLEFGGWLSEIVKKYACF